MFQTSRRVWYNEIAPEGSGHYLQEQNERKEQAV